MGLALSTPIDNLNFKVALVFCIFFPVGQVYLIITSADRGDNSLQDGLRKASGSGAAMALSGPLLLSARIHAASIPSRLANDADNPRLSCYSQAAASVSGQLEQHYFITNIAIHLANSFH